MVMIADISVPEYAGRLHIYRCEHPRRVRMTYPHHKHLCYGERQGFYDTRCIFFDCGTFVDYGYVYYEKPKLYKSIEILKDEVGFTARVRRAGFRILAKARLELPPERAGK